MSDIVVVQDPPEANVVEVVSEGPVGPQGPAGATGPQGSIGNTGPQGPTGAPGAFTISLINNTGAPSVKGSVVSINAPGAVGLKTIGDPDPIGVILSDGVANGGLVDIVVGGIAEVLFVGQTVAGHFARTFLSSESGTFEAGKAKSEAVPTTPFATDKHFCEIGHVIDTIVAPGLARVVLHFN